MNKVNTKGQWPRADTARPTPSRTLASEPAHYSLEHMGVYNALIIVQNYLCCYFIPLTNCGFILDVFLRR